MVHLRNELGSSGKRSAMTMHNTSVKDRHSSLAERTPQPYKGAPLSKSNSMMLESLDARMDDAAIRCILTQENNQYFDKRLHESTLRKKILKWGTSKAKVESQLFERAERVRDTSFFQDLGIKNRQPRKPPNFRNSREFLNHVESSDEELAEKGDVVVDASRNIGQGISKSATAGTPQRFSA